MSKHSGSHNQVLHKVINQKQRLCNLARPPNALKWIINRPDVAGAVL